MKKLREYYERELGILHGYAQEFATEYPAQATRLGMADGAGDDPHVERLIQATALSNARVARLIDDNDSKLTEALLTVNFPHYLRPFPSTAIVHVDAGQNAAATVTRLPRGTMLTATSPDGVPCKFRTVQDVVLAPLVLSHAKFHPLAELPLSVRRPMDVTSSLSIGIECRAGADLGTLDLAALRLLIAGEPALCAALRDVLFMLAKTAYLELEDGTWRILDAVPVVPAGFGDDDAVLPWPAAAHPAFRLLAEYSACPDKFNFIDLQWPALARYVSPGCLRLTLHLGLTVPHDSPTARLLATMSATNLLPACTPAVNLFRRSASPIELTHATSDYELMPDASPASAYDVFSVDKVTIASEARRLHAEFRPYYSVHHGEQHGKGRYYLLRRDAIRAVTHPGREMRIALVDSNLDPLAGNDASVSIDLTCTNRDLPARLRHGAPAGDLQLEQATQGWTLRFLHRPTPQFRFNPEHHWRLVSLLSFGHASLAQQGVDGLREVLALHDLRQSAITQRQIRGIAALAQRRARVWLPDKWHRTPVYGTEIRVTLDEQAFVGTSLHLFAQVLDHLFGLCAHINSFTQLTIVSLAEERELLRCPPRHGNILLA